MEYDCGNMAERIIDRTEQPVVGIGDLDEDDIAQLDAAMEANSESDISEPLDDEEEPATATATTKIYRKRAATLSSPKQRKHKQLKTSAPPSAFEDTDSHGGEPSRRPSRRPMPTLKVRENNQQGNEADNADTEDEEEAPQEVGKQL